MAARTTRVRAGLTQQFGDHLRSMRRAAGLTAVDLAGRAGLTPSTLWRIEAGNAEPNLGTLYKLAWGFGVQVAELFPEARA